MAWGTAESPSERAVLDSGETRLDWEPDVGEPGPVVGAQRAEVKYQPKEARTGTALCLSGGGYRAALFHLGALTRLNELRVLGQITTLTAVSGGSILAALVGSRIAAAQEAGVLPHWPVKKPILDWHAEIVEPMRRFTSRNIRTLWVLQMLWPGSWPASTVAVHSLQHAYEKGITGIRLNELPQKPRFVLCATDLVFGCGWVSERDGVGDYQAGYAVPDPSWPVAQAVAASSCFPPVFNPLPIGLGPEELRDGRARLRPDRDELIGGLRLSDGGVYDNLGLEPVWKDHAEILVSDAGGSLDYQPDRGLFKRLRRYMAISEAQGTEVRKRWLISSFLDKKMSGTYWGVASHARAYDQSAPGYSEAVVDQLISRVRTDLDAFSEAEQCILENHGYLIADAAIRTHAPDLLESPPPPPTPPHEYWMNEGRVRLALAKSSKRQLFGHWRRTLSAASGTPQGAPPESAELLARFCPTIQYDSDEQYFADSPAVMTNLASPQSSEAPAHANRLLRADGQTAIAIAGADPASDIAPLTLEFLGEEKYADGKDVLGTDYIDAGNHAYADDASLMHANRELADVCFGHARLDQRRRLWLQYWFFFYYDDFEIAGALHGGKHEGDWEMIQLRIGLGRRVAEVTYAQHNYAQQASWGEIEHADSDDGQVPLVYCAVGSHASYMRAGEHRAPVGFDHNDGQGRRVRPRLEEVGDMQPAWVRWPGVWGSTQKRAWWDSDSPRGPQQHVQWFDPATFAKRARPAPSTAPGEIVRFEVA